MSRKLLTYLGNLINDVERLLPFIFRQGGPPPALSLAAQPSYWTVNCDRSQHRPYSFKDLLGDGFLWAVPKHRRTIEKRLKRKFGFPEYSWKLLRVKTHLRTCNHCGHDYEAGLLCTNCYQKVREETKLMQEKIQEELGLEPIEKDVIVLYEGERKEQPAEFLNGKRIVEMPKLRPMWFTKNLLQKTTQQPATTKEVKPNDLA
uniref:Large ribosomal subunit protein bL32m n=1 Tax=Glossina morsitans morsitans TaxID=37546 RepID=A0A1B0F9Z2_GLOMM